MELWDDNRWMDGLHGLWADNCASSTPHNVYRKPDEEREAFSRSCASSLLSLGDEGDIRSERVCVLARIPALPQESTPAFKKCGPLRILVHQRQSAFCVPTGANGKVCASMSTQSHRSQKEDL